MKSAVLVHGTCDHDEYLSDEYPSLSNSHWFPWLQKQFLLAGYLAYTPEMPDAYAPNFEVWRREFERYPLSQESVLVGHSCGAGFLLRWLTESRVTIKRLVLVAPWLDPRGTKGADFFAFKFDADLTKRMEVHLLASSDDDDDIHRSIALIHQALPHVVRHDFTGYGHFCFADMGDAKFPRLREIALYGM